jgi:hypothetical protein
MSIGHRPTPPEPADPPPDLTLKQAEQVAQRDYARLLHAHSPAWSIDIFCGLVRWTCSCDKPGPYNAAALDTHILKEVRDERGPVRPPTKR